MFNHWVKKNFLSNNNKFNTGWRRQSGGKQTAEVKNPGKIGLVSTRLILHSGKHTQKNHHTVAGNQECKITTWHRIASGAGEYISVADCRGGAAVDGAHLMSKDKGSEQWESILNPGADCDRQAGR